MSRKRDTSANERWLAYEALRRAEAGRSAARQQCPVEGFSVIRLPSLDEVLDEVQPPQTRHAGGAG